MYLGLATCLRRAPAIVSLIPNTNRDPSSLSPPLWLWLWLSLLLLWWLLLWLLSVVWLLISKDVTHNVTSNLLIREKRINK